MASAILDNMYNYYLSRITNNRFIRLLSRNGFIVYFQKLQE